MAIWGGFVFGLDTDTLESLQETVRLACEAKLEFAQFSRLTPLPGTAQWNQFQSEGRIIDTDWSKFNFQHVVYKPRLMSADDLNRSIREAWFEFYSVRRMVQRLGRTRTPVTKGNLRLWALNLGINRIMRRFAASSGPVRTKEMPPSVFDTLPQSSR